jgi:hypothetical protein
VHPAGLADLVLLEAVDGFDDVDDLTQPVGWRGHALALSAVNATKRPMPRGLWRPARDARQRFDPPRD